MTQLQAFSPFSSPAAIASKHVQVIMGIIPSKTNRKGIRVIPATATKKAIAIVYKPTAQKEYEASFANQCNKYRNANISQDFEIEADVYFSRRNADLDNAFKCILDCLQEVDAITNDNLCVRIVANKYIDASNPRVEFTLKII